MLDEVDVPCDNSFDSDNAESPKKKKHPKPVTPLLI